MIHEQPQNVTISLSLDKQLSEGFVVAVAVHLAIFLLLIVYVLQQPPERIVTHIPMEMIRLGLGEGAGSGGNLSAPGTPHKGNEPDNPLEDASRQQQVKQAVKTPEVFESGRRPIAADVSDARKSRDTAGGHGRKDVGSPNGSPNGTGLQGNGNGPGSGLGYGINWGGGGDRTVLNKVLPTYPPGVDKSAQIRYRIFVDADGSIAGMIPTQKGDPRFEEEVTRALRKWKFSKSSAQRQVAEITFSFKVN